MVVLESSNEWKRILQSAKPDPEKVDRASGLLTKRSVTSTTALLAYLGLADFAVHMLFAATTGTSATSSTT